MRSDIAVAWQYERTSLHTLLAIRWHSATACPWLLAACAALVRGTAHGVHVHVGAGGGGGFFTIDSHVHKRLDKTPPITITRPPLL